MEAKLSDFSKLLLDSPKNSWIALNEEETQIVGTGPTLEEAVSAAKRNGIDDPLLLLSPKDWTPRVF
jgi:hypothetical protein